MPASNSSRMLFVDMLRGIAMILVVLMHSEVYFFGSSNSCNEFLSFYRMPMFFFISGVLLYSPTFTTVLFKKRLSSRIVAQLFPTIVFFTVYTIVFPYFTFEGAIFSVTKNGYWFPLVSIALFLLWTPLLLIVSKVSVKRSGIFAFIILAGIVLYALTKLDVALYDHNQVFYNRYIYSLLMMQSVVKNSVFFIFGMVTSAIFRAIDSREVNRNRVGVISALTVAILVIAHQWGIKHTGMELLLSPLCIAGVLFGVFFMAYSLNDHLSKLRIFRYTAVIGTMTLEIYLLHFFFLSGFNEAKRGTGLTDGVSTLWHIPMAFVIIALCLLTVRVMKRIGVYRFLFPKYKDFDTLVKRMKAGRMEFAE